MIRTSTFLVLLLFSVLCTHAQQPSPTPTPPQSDDGQVVKISTELIQIDVTVTDNKGVPIRDLRPEEVTIFENGKKQGITNFSFVDNARSTTTVATTKAERKSVLPNAEPIRPEDVRRTIALVVDDISLSFESSFWVKKALLKFVDEQMQPGDLVAIIRTAGGVGVLQQFTNDKRQLYAAIANIRFRFDAGNRIGLFNTSETTAPVTGEDAGSVESQADIERELNDFRAGVFATGTLGAISYIVKGMRELPGRKSIMLLSDGIPVFNRDKDGNQKVSDLVYQMQRLTDLANRAAVVIYTMDAKGLQSAGLDSSVDTAGLTGADISRLESDQINDIRDAQDSLRLLAERTGGMAFVNQNDIPRVIRKVLNDQSYYLVGYSPDDEVFDAKTRKFNKLVVKVSRPGARVRYRSGFFGIDDELIAKKLTTGSPAEAIIGAITSPFAVNGITVKMTALFAGDEKRKPFIKAFLNIEGADLKFEPQPDGRFKTSYDILAMTFGTNGTVIDQESKNISIIVNERQRLALLKRGLQSSFVLPLKDPGAYQLRIALRDEATGKVGSASQFVEVPDLKKGRLNVSGVVLETFSPEVWARIDQMTPAQLAAASDPQVSTALRTFSPGSILRFGYTVYNPKIAKGTEPQLTTKLRLFRENEMVFEGADRPLTELSNSPGSIMATGVIKLGGTLAPGYYVLRITITDHQRKSGKDTVEQFVTFEIKNEDRTN